MLNRKFRRLGLIIGASVLACAYLSAHAQDLTDLGAIAPATGINNSGQVVLQNYLYSGGTLTPLPAGMVGLGISNNGAVVGAVATASGFNCAAAAIEGEGGSCAVAVYSNGTLTQYPIFHSSFDPSVGNWGAGINDSGTVVGWYAWIHFQGGAIVFDDGTPSDLAFPGQACGGGLDSAIGKALAINDAGQITGTLGYATPTYSAGEVNCVQSAFLLSQGTYTDLGPGQGNAINASGLVTGWAFIGAAPPGGSATSEGAIFDNGAITLLPGTEAGNGINDSGFVVGDASYGAFFYNGIVTNLNDWIAASDPLKPYVTLSDARGIDDSGLVVVNGSDSRTQAQHAYLMQVPLIRVTPGPLVFPTGSSASQSVTFTNAGTSTTALGAVSISGSFSIQTNSCTSSLAAGAACEVVVSPIAGGTTSGSLTLLAAGVPIEVPVTVSAPLAVSISANATTVAPGLGLRLTWTATSGATCTATGGTPENGWTGLQPASGTQELAGLPVGSYTFGLTCTLGSQTSSANVTVVVAVPALNVTLSASPATIKSGGSVTLTWTSNGTSCNASGGGPNDGWAAVRPPNGSATITESTAVAANQSSTILFTITCMSSLTNNSGSATAQVVDDGPTTVATQLPPSGGGGAFDFLSGLCLLAMLAMRELLVRAGAMIIVRKVIRLAAPALAMAIAGQAAALAQEGARSLPPGAPLPNLTSSAVPPAQLPDVSVIAPPPPTAAELAGDSVFQFIVHHATTHYTAATGNVGGSLLRWRGGRSETLCPQTVGLDQGYDAFVTARVRAIASFVGAPVQPDLRCKPNVQIIFTTEPGNAMEAVQQWGARSLHVRFDHQMVKALQISGEHAIQGWYLTAGGGSSVLNRDPGLVGGVALEALWPRVIPTSVRQNGSARSILAVFLVIDTNKVAGATIGSIADYLAVVALTVAESPDHCDPLPSILDLMSPTCGSREKPTGITAGDVAFLKALYYHNTGLGGTLSRDDMQTNMLNQFRGT